MKNKYDNNESAVFYKPQMFGNVDLVVQETGYEKCDPGHAWGPGKKPAHCIHYCLRGKGKLIVKNKTFEIGEGQIFYCSPDNISYYEADKKEPWEYIWVNFNGSIVSNVFKCTNISPTNPIIYDINFEMRDFFRKILNVFEKKEKHFFSSTGYLYLLLGRFIDLYGNNTDPNVYLRSIIDQSINIILANICGNISVDSLAKRVGLCRSQLYRIFISELGYSPKDYITRLKITYAAELIKSGNMTIYKAAAEVGYYNYNSFAKSFKRIIGLMPTEFIAKNKSGEFVIEGTYLDFVKSLSVMDEKHHK